MKNLWVFVLHEKCNEMRFYELQIVEEITTYQGSNKLVITLKMFPVFQALKKLVGIASAASMKNYLEASVIVGIYLKRFGQFFCNVYLLVYCIIASYSLQYNI